jgi:TonB family protein
MFLHRIFPVIVLGLFFLPDRATGKEASPDKGFAFYGDVVAIDPHLITIKSGGKRLVFQITEETKISGRDRPLHLDQIKPGDGATVMMKLGQGNVGIAVQIRVDAGWSISKSLKMYAARTTSGTVVSGMAINNYIAYRPADDGWMGGATLERAQNDGVFLLQVRPDGTVSGVKMVKSMGYNELNVHAIRAFKGWRFHPNTVTEVQMPMSYLQSKYWR